MKISRPKIKFALLGIIMLVMMLASNLSPAAPLVTAQENAQPTVLATYEFHQVTNLTPHGVNYYNGSHPRNNGWQIVFNTPNPNPGQRRAVEVMVVGFDGADPQVVDRYEDFWEVLVDIGDGGPVHVLSTNGWELRIVELKSQNRAAGSSQRLVAINGPEIRQISMENVPYYLLRAGADRTDKSGSLGAGLYIQDTLSEPQLRIGSERVAEAIGISPQEIVSFNEFDVGATESTTGPNIVFTVHVDARPSQQPEKNGVWFFSMEGPGAGKLTQVQTGPADYGNVRVSANGEKIFYREGQKIWMMDWPGGGPKRLIADGLGHHEPQPDITGQHVLIGESGFLVNTDDLTQWPLFSTTLNKESFGFQMHPQSMRISMITRRDGIPSQVGAMRMDTPLSEILSTTPRIMEYTIQPGGLISDRAGRASILSAKIEPADSIVSVPWVLLKGTRVSNGYWLYDQDRADAGFVAGDGIFDGFMADAADPAEKTRVLRIHAESEDAQGYHHAYAIEAGPYPVGPLPETPQPAQTTEVIPPAEPGNSTTGGSTTGGSTTGGSTTGGTTTGGSTTPSTQCLQELETITVPATTADLTSSTTVLEAGQAYSLQISGVFSFWDNSGQTAGVDALYRYNESTGQSQTFWSPLQINDKPLKEWIEDADGTTEYNGDHLYTVGIVGDGKALTLWISDSYYSDNSGNLTVKLCAAPGGLTTGESTPGEATPSNTVLPTPPYGQPEPYISVAAMTLQAGQRQVLAGELVTVPVWLIYANNVANMNFEMSYDTGVAQLEGDIPKGSLLDNALFTFNPNENSVIPMGFAQTTGVYGTGAVAYVPFRAVGQPGDRTQLTLAVTKINDPDGTELAIDRIYGEITIMAPGGSVPGDCDGDGRMTALDALCALEMSVRLRPEALNLDLDNDSAVTSRDSTLILQSIFNRS